MLNIQHLNHNKLDSVTTREKTIQTRPITNTQEVKLVERHNARLPIAEDGVVQAFQPPFITATAE